ncbi:MAG TPA: hypothetical protein VGU63_09940 [Candidatus Acidoferrales bacterium]|nr:hypothetical protein [Candidatus Acidoferrales bacterium]
MSIIWDSLDSRREEEREDSPSGDPLNSFGSGPDRRKSSRANVYVPLFVYGYDSAAEPFHQDTHTLEVSGSGGLLRLDANVRRGQKLLLMNRVTKQEQECYVVGLKRHPKRSHLHVGVSFAQPAPGFWKTQRA